MLLVLLLMLLLRTRGAHHHRCLLLLSLQTGRAAGNGVVLFRGRRQNGRGQLLLGLFPPRGKAVEQSEGVLRRSVEGHLVLVLAPLLSECTHTFVHPLVAVHFDLLLLTGRRERSGRD